MSVHDARVAIQQIIGATPDGVWGERQTWPLLRKLARLPSDAPWPDVQVSLVVPALLDVPDTIPSAAYQLILDSEGIDQPFRWPGLDSGISLGPGMDLSAETKAELHEAFDRWLTPDQVTRLEGAVGKSGQAAASMANQFRDIHISREMSDDVFYRVIVPKYYKQMLAAYPGIDQLPGAVQGAVLSCGYNRGWAKTGDRRREMAEIGNIVSDATLTQKDKVFRIAQQLKSMQRLWADNPNSFDDLHDRRAKEADLCLTAIA